MELRATRRDDLRRAAHLRQAEQRRRYANAPPMLPYHSVPETLAWYKPAHQQQCVSLMSAQRPLHVYELGCQRPHEVHQRG